MCTGQPSQCYCTPRSGYQIYEKVGHYHWGRHFNLNSIYSGELHVVVEYCDNGNLKNYIVARKNNFSNELSSQELNEDGTPKITQYVVSRINFIEANCTVE